ncbi:hypothetical protein Pfo_000240 [Paulownia fortunei]|nr:hypothetical protein Pfo_000240 [Paulownia fortunei]
MLYVRAAARTHALAFHPPPPLRRKPFKSLSPSFIRMSSSDSPSNPNQIIEHVVLYKAKPDADPSAVNAMLSNVNGLVSLDSPVVDDIMAVDWVADDFSGSPVVSPGSAMRLTILKLKAGTGESGKREVWGVVRGVKEKFPSIEQLTVGENFSPGEPRGLKELEALDSESELANEQKDKAREFLDGVVVLDYVVAAAASVRSASL